MNGNPYRGEPADVWSTGVVLFALLVGNTPWDEPTKRSAEFVAYVNGQSYEPWPRIDPDALSLLHQMMCVNPNKRISIEGIKKHRWFTRRNPLLVDGQAPDAISLAERLLQGLIVSGDLDFNLHSDGKRAAVPDNISLTQPEAFGPGLELNLNRVPPSSALPAFKATTDPRRLALSQQITSRSHNVPSTNTEGYGIAAGAAGSQFTQAMNHMTQWSNLAGGTARFSPHLTRLFCSASGPIVARHIIDALQALLITHAVLPIGSNGEEMAPSPSASSLREGGTQGDEMDMDVDMSGSGDHASSNASRRDTEIGSRGARIRVSTTDRRKCALRGEIWIETITPDNDEDDDDDEGRHQRVARTHVLMKRSKGDPLEWRRLFRALATSEGVKELIVTT